MTTADELRVHPLFLGTDPEALSRVLAQIPAREVCFTNGRIVMVQGDPCDRLTVIIKGTLSATMESPSGKSLLVETLQPPDMIAPALLFAPEPVIPVTLTALTDGRAVSIARGQVEAIGRNFPSIYIRLLEHVGEKFAFLTTKMRLLHFATLRQKIAGYLLERKRQSTGTRIDIPYTRERLAELFGVARPSLSRVLGEMAREGIVSLAGSTIQIADLPALERTARSEE